MKKNIKNIVVLALVAFAIGKADRIQAQTNANPPELMTYQGYLVDGNGSALGTKAPTNYDTVFRIYGAKQGGAAIWAEQQTVTVDKGYFSVVLGEGSKFGNEPHAKLSSIFFGSKISDRYIGITVITGDGSSTEIAPRLRFLSSPFAFTASQARRLTDDSGNSNFYKDGGSLKLGAGSATTLTLAEGGNATLTGKLTADLPGWGAGLQINNFDHETLLGGKDANSFEFRTTLPAFSFNKPIKAPTIYLGAYTLTASNGNFGSVMTTNSRAGWGGYSINGKYVFMSNDAGDHGGIYNDHDNRWIYYHSRTGDWHRWYSDGNNIRLTLDKSGLHVAEHLYANGNVMKVTGSSPTVYFHDSNHNDYFIHANSNRLYFLHGEGSWNGNRPITILDGNKVGINTADPKEALDVRGNIAVNGKLLVSGGGLTTPTGNYGTIQTTGNRKGNWDGYSINGRYVFMSHDNNQVGIYNDIDNKWVTLYEKTGASGGRYAIFLNNAKRVLNMQHTNGGRYASYDGDSNWDFYSDRRLKEEIAKEDNLLNRIMNLEVVNYRFIGEEKRQHKELGLIAQDVEPLFPSLVTEQHDDRYDFKIKSIGYNSFGVIAIGGIKELKQQTDAATDSLRAENKALKEELKELKNEMEIVKARLTNVGKQEERLARLEELVQAIEPGE